VVGILLIGLLVACYSCIEIGDTKSGNKGMVVHAFDHDVYLGVASLVNKSCKNLKVTGTLHADNLIVTGSARVVGSAIVVDSNIAELSVLGKAKLNNLTVTKRLKLTGKAKINTGSYPEISLHGQNFELCNLTVAGSITIKTDHHKNDNTARLVLYNCQIAGDVICLSPNCELIVDSTTKITGKIFGFAKNKGQALLDLNL
jgi:small basic protein